MKNIVFVIADQMRFDSIHALGNNIVHTPVLDSLIEHGVAFTKAYTPCPVCAPARYSLHTGLMPHDTGLFENCELPPVATNKSFMQHLQEAGYQTFGSGKMHFGFPEGWDSLWGFDSRKMCDIDDNLDKNDFYQAIKEDGYGYVYDYKGVRSEMYYVPQTSLLPEKLHHSHWTVDSSIEFLENREKDKPFFLMTSFEKPHPPFTPPIPWNKLYRGPDMPLPKRPERCDDLITLWNEFQNRYKYRDQGEDDNLIRQMIAYYYAEVSFLDYNLGRLVNKLKSEGVLEDTLIVFTADHGEMLGDYHCYGKRSFLDSSAKIPFIMCMPKEAKGITCDEPISLMDIYPTFMKYAGIEVEGNVAGTNLVEIIRGTTKRQYVIGEYEKGEYANYMIADKRFKYIYSVPDEKEYLFDHQKDEKEYMNRAKNPLYLKKTKEMRETLIQYFVEEGFTAPIENGTWKKFGVKTLDSSPDAYLLFQDSVGTVQEIPNYSDGDEICNKEWHEFKWLSDSYEEYTSAEKEKDL